MENKGVWSADVCYRPDPVRKMQQFTHGIGNYEEIKVVVYYPRFSEHDNERLNFVKGSEYQRLQAYPKKTLIHVFFFWKIIFMYLLKFH